MHRLARLAAIAAPAVVAGALAFAAPAAAGGPHTPGAACSTAGATFTKHGQTYDCSQRKGETCPHWHWRYDRSVPTSGRTDWTTGPCERCHPTPPPATSPPAQCWIEREYCTPPATPPATSTPPVEVPPTPPSTSTSSSPAAVVDEHRAPPAAAAPPLVPVAESLPVTGDDVAWTAPAGAALVGVGALLMLAGRRRRVTA